MSSSILYTDKNFRAQFIDKFGFDESEFSELCDCFEIQQVKKKDYILRAGEFCNHKRYLHKGCARNFVVDEKGHERILFFGFEDWWLGDFESYYSGVPATNYVQALEDCELFCISKEHFSALEKRIPKLSRWYSVKVPKAASASFKRLEQVKMLTPEERYLQLLAAQPHIFQRVPLQYIAAYLNIEPPSLSRMRKRLSGK